MKKLDAFQNLFQNLCVHIPATMWALRNTTFYKRNCWCAGQFAWFRIKVPFFSSPHLGNSVAASLTNRSWPGSGQFHAARLLQRKNKPERFDDMLCTLMVICRSPCHKKCLSMSCPSGGLAESINDLRRMEASHSSSLILVRSPEERPRGDYAVKAVKPKSSFTGFR